MPQTEQVHLSLCRMLFIKRNYIEILYFVDRSSQSRLIKILKLKVRVKVRTLLLNNKVTEWMQKVQMGLNEHGDFQIEEGLTYVVRKQK